MNTCCALVRAGTDYTPCSRNGSVERDGKWYCGQHDPQAVADRRKAREFNGILSALKTLVDLPSGEGEDMRAIAAARAAIAKAEGTEP